MVSKGVTTNQKGKPAKHRNHTVPKALLKRWLVQFEGRIGHWVLDCASGTVAFHPGDEASFAISEFRYVPVRAPSGQAPYRDEMIEDWFSKGESDLALITDRLLSNQRFANQGNSVGGFIQAAILLGFRSAYEYTMLGDRLTAEDPQATEQEIARRVVDHFKLTYTRKLRQFNNWDYQIVPTNAERILVCDRPMFDMTVNQFGNEMLAIPLTPFLMLIATPPSDRNRKSYSFTVANVAKPTLVTLINRFTVERARQFIVGTHAELEALRPAFAAAQFQKRKKTDRFVAAPL